MRESLRESLLVSLEHDDPPANERTALLKSLIMPGWGHFGLSEADAIRGRIHMGTDLSMIAAYAGLGVRASSLTDDYLTLAELRAGVPMSNRDRTFLLAMGNFNSLEAYNDYQLRSRNWNQLIEDIPENRWQWTTDDDRRRFRDIRERADQTNNQLPAILGFMVMNRVLSGISAFNRTRSWNDAHQLAKTVTSRYQSHSPNHQDRPDEPVAKRNTKGAEKGRIQFSNLTFRPVIIHQQHAGFTTHLQFRF